jgi:hypothetical protein
MPEFIECSALLRNPRLAYVEEGSLQLLNAWGFPLVTNMFVLKEHHAISMVKKMDSTKFRFCSHSHDISPLCHCGEIPYFPPPKSASNPPDISTDVRLARANSTLLLRVSCRTCIPWLGCSPAQKPEIRQCLRYVSLTFPNHHSSDVATWGCHVNVSQILQIYKNSLKNKYQKKVKFIPILGSWFL